MTLKEVIVKTIQQLTPEDKKFLDKVCTHGRWNQNPKTGLIDVEGNVNLDSENLTKIPVKFGIVTKNFNCNNNELTTLKGCPIKVGGGFDCSYNLLKSLQECTKHIGGGFSCFNNQLTSLEGCPEIIIQYFNCYDNQLQSAKYLPKMIKNYKECIDDINYQKSEYLISMGFDPKKKKLFQELMDELEK